MGTEVVVAVCTNRPPDAIEESLSALALQVPEERLMVVASAVPANQYRERFGVDALEEQATGLSRARNRALHSVGDEVVLAFVDDDAVVHPGWYEALGRAWADAAVDVGCIGGPIRPRWPGGAPPAWVSAPILPALTLLDLGGSRLELDPATTTVYGANISFRTAPLRAAGGFDPAYGHSGRRVSFSEEDQAQRALAAAGYRTLYVPDVVVDHVIPAERLRRASFVRRRFAYGRTLGRRGARGRGIALRQMLSSSAGAFAAGLTGQDALFMERAVRAAENAGVVLAARRGAATLAARAGD